LIFYFVILLWLPSNRAILYWIFFFEIHRLTLVIRLLVSLFVLLFFFKLYRFYILSNRLVRLIMVDSDFFPSIFLWIFFFLQFHPLVLNYWPLSYVIFSLFFLLGYPECELVKLTRINLHSLPRCFFI
jgi:hypothetical protein